MHRPRQALRVPGGSDSQISRQSAHEGGKVVSPTHRQPLPPKEIFLALISIRDWVDPSATVRPEGLCQWKMPMTPTGNEPATFWLVVQYFNELRYRVSLGYTYTSKIQCEKYMDSAGLGSYISQHSRNVHHHTWRRGEKSYVAQQVFTIFAVVK